MTPEQYEIPKVDLHRHVEGSIRPATAFEFGLLYNRPLPVLSPEEAEKLLRVDGPVSDIMTFIKKLDLAVTTLGSLDACSRIAYETVADAAADGVAVLKARFSPGYMAAPNNLPPTGVVEAVIDGFQRAEKDFYPMIVLPEGILSRTFGHDACEIELNALLTQKDAIVGLDLAGDEFHYPPGKFDDLYERARDAGWEITIHAGEVPGSLQNIRIAIDLLGATRLGHALKAAEDPRLMDYIAEKGIAVESCLTSNVQTMSVPDYISHPLKTFLQHGILATINTDDPQISGITLTHELTVAAPLAGLTPREIKRAQLNALKIALFSFEERMNLKTQRE